MQLGWQPPCFDSAQTASIAAPVVAFIGDVHGYSNRLDYVLEHIPDHAHIVFLGDLIDRGPQSREVVATARSLITAGRASAIIGNHEYALVRGLGIEERGIPGNEELLTAWCYRYGGDVTVMSYGLDPFHPEWPHQLRDTLGDDLYFWLISPGIYGASMKANTGSRCMQAWISGHSSRSWRNAAPACAGCVRIYHTFYTPRIVSIPAALIFQTTCAWSAATRRSQKRSLHPGVFWRIPAAAAAAARSQPCWPSGEVIASPPMAGE